MSPSIAHQRRSLLSLLIFMASSYISRDAWRGGGGVSDYKCMIVEACSDVCACVWREGVVSVCVCGGLLVCVCVWV